MFIIFYITFLQMILPEKSANDILPVSCIWWIAWVCPDQVDGSWWGPTVRRRASGGRWRCSRSPGRPTRGPSRDWKARCKSIDSVLNSSQYFGLYQRLEAEKTQINLYLSIDIFLRRASGRWGTEDIDQHMWQKCPKRCIQNRWRTLWEYYPV